MTTQPQNPPRPPVATPYDRGDFDDGEWGHVPDHALTPEQRLALGACQSGANTTTAGAGGIHSK